MTLAPSPISKAILALVALLSIILSGPTIAHAQTEDAAVRLKDANLILSRIPDGWNTNQLSEKSENGTVFSATHSQNGSLCLIACSLVGMDHQPTPDMIAEELIDTYAHSNTIEVRSTERSAKTLLGMNGLRVTLRGISRGEKVNVIAWVGASNGREYRFTVIVPGNEAAAIVVLNDWLAQLKLIDATARIDAVALPAPKPFTSPRFGYTISLPGGVGWRQVTSDSSGIASVEFAAGIGGHTYFVVQPLYLGADVDPEDLGKACSMQTANSWTSATTKTPIKIGNDFAGFLLTRNPDGKQQPFHYRSLIVGGRNCAFLVMGWTSRKDQIMSVESALRAVKLDTIPLPNERRAPRRKSATAATLFEKRSDQTNPTAGLAQNELGLLTMARGQPEVAAEIFESALDECVEPTICSNYLQALLGSKDLDRAVEVLPLMLKTFPRDEQIATQGATVYEMVNQPEQAIEMYRIIFPAKQHDDARFARFIELLLERHDTDLAKRHIAAYKKHTDNDVVASLEADTFLEMNEPAKALSLLEKRITTRMPPERLLVSYCIALVRLDRTEEAIKKLDALERDNGTSPELLVIRGQTYLLSSDYEKAKTAFEAAQRLRPNDATIQQYVLASSARSGQGSNAALNQPIDAVPLPVGLQAGDASKLDQSAGAGYQLYGKATRFEQGKRQRTTTYQTINIFDQNGVDTFTTITLELNPTFERIYVNTLEVMDESGKVIQTGNPQTYYLQDRDKEGVASFKQSACLPVPGLRPGCTIRLVATKETKSIQDQLDFTDEWLGHFYPTLDAFYSLSGDVERIKSVEHFGVSKQVSPGQILWTIRNPPRVVLEPMMSPAESFLPRVSILDNDRTWTGEAMAYQQMIASRLASIEAVKNELHSLQIEGKTPMQKLRAVVEHVDKKFTYKALAFGPRARMPTDPAEILRNRYGDCKDMSLITHLLLTEAGVKSNLALVHARGPVTTELPSLDQFDHMIVHVPDCEGSWWIDCTGDDADPIMTSIPPFYLQGRDALILDGVKSQLVHIPDWDSSTSNVQIDRKVELTEEGRLKVEDQINLRGAIAHYYRSAIRETEASRREAKIVELCALRTNEIRDSHASAENVDDYLKPLSLRVRFSPRQKLKLAGSRLVGDLPTTLETFIIAPELIDDRKTPMYDAYGVHLNIQLSLSLPNGMLLEGIDNKPINLASDFGKGSVRFARNDRGYAGELSIASPSIEAPAAKYAPFCEWRQSIVDAWAIPLIVTKSK